MQQPTRDLFDAFRSTATLPVASGNVQYSTAFKYGLSRLLRPRQADRRVFARDFCGRPPAGLRRNNTDIEILPVKSSAEATVTLKDSVHDLAMRRLDDILSRSGIGQQGHEEKKIQRLSGWRKRARFFACGEHGQARI